jgi:hypothetical protein
MAGFALEDQWGLIGLAIVLFIVIYVLLRLIIHRH